jgi:methionyl aminopeptidase
MIANEYYKAGKIAAEVRADIESKDIVGMDYELLCNYVEKEILRRGGRPAFPCNICVNATAAHYTAEPEDRQSISERDVAKIDIGVHVDGHIADTATTLCYDSNYAGLVEATRNALAEALRLVRDGAKTSEIGRVISSVAEKNGFRPIANLSGHLLDLYTIHGGISIPNIWTPKSSDLVNGKVYAIEPFLTKREGAGVVVDSPTKNIFALLTRKKTNSKELDEFVDLLWKEFKTLPFAKRWLTDRYPRSRLDFYLGQLERMRIVHSYPVLVEAKGATVAQAEHTVAPDGNGFVVLTL